MLNFVFNLFQRWRWLRIGVGVVTLYLLVLWIMPQCIDKAALRAYLREWCEQTLDETSPVEIDRLDTALREHGRVDLYLEDVAFSPPNFEFAPPWLEFDTIRASAPFYELWGGIRPSAQIRISNPQLRLQWKNGESNLDGLRIAPTPRFPFSSFDLGDFAIAVNGGKITLNHPLISGNFSVFGNGEYHTIGADHAEVAHLRIDGNVDFPDAPVRRDADEIRNFSVTVSGAKWQLENPHPLTHGNIAIVDLPLRALNLLSPSLPAFSPISTFSGVLELTENQWRLRGKVHRPPMFSDDVAIDLIADLMTDGATFTLHLRTGERQVEVAAARWRWHRDGRRESLELEIPILDISDFPALFVADLTAWRRWLFSYFPDAQIRVAQLIWRNFHFDALTLAMTSDADKNLDITAETAIAGGKILLLVNALPTGDNFGSPPKNFRMAFDIPALGDTLLFFSDYLPALYQIRPLRGKGQATVRYESGDADNSLKIQLALTDVLIPGLPAGEMLQALLSISEGMREAENLTRRSALNVPPLLATSLSADDRQLTLTSVVATYQIDPQGNNSLTLLEADSPQLGKISGDGESNLGGSFRLTLRIKSAPENLFADLSPATRAVAEEVMASDGLRIDGLTSPSGGAVERRYIQDIFRRWLDEQGNH